MAIGLDTQAYRRRSELRPGSSGKGIAVSVVAGVMMGLFYRLKLVV